MAGHYLLDVCGHPVLHVSDYKKRTAPVALGRKQ